MKRLVSLLIISLMLLSIVSPMAIATGVFTVSGTVQLAEPAPDGGLVLVLTLLPPVQTGGGQQSGEGLDLQHEGGGGVQPPSGHIFFSAGQDQGSFTIPDVPAGSYTLNYMLTPPQMQGQGAAADDLSDYLSAQEGFQQPPSYEGPLVGQGFYLEPGTVTDSQFLASVVSVSQNRTVNFTIPKAHTVSGVLSLPQDSDPAPQDITFSILRYSQTGDTDFYLEKFPPINYMDPSNTSSFTIPAGNTSGEFSFKSAPGAYRFAYNLGTMEDPITGFYNSQGTATNPYEAEEITLDSDKVINMTILEDMGGGDPTDKVPVSGIIAPALVQSTQFTVRVTLLGGAKNVAATSDVTIPADAASINYSIDVKPGTYKVHYEIVSTPKPQALPWEGFYSTHSEFVNNWHAATSIEVGTEGVVDIDYVLPELHFVSGSLSIPQNITAGTHLAVIMSYGKTFEQSLASFSVPIMQMEAAETLWMLRVPAGEYYIYYEVKNSHQYLSPGYWAASDTTVTDPDHAATFVVVSEMQDAFDLALLPGGDGPVIALGDVNGDGVIDVRDVILIMRHAQDLQTLTGDQLERADVDGSGSVDREDAQLVLDLIVGKIGALPGLTPEG